MENYEAVLDQLYNQYPPFQKYGATSFKPGLERISAMVEKLDHPQKTFPCIHIAGTNGKGSTAHILAAVLQKAGFKTGVYTSPHLVDFRERIKINAQYITRSQVVSFYNLVQDKLADLSPSFFEVTTLMAFQHFCAEEVDIAILETGMGGRLDATNIVQPLCSVITPISMDHQQYLGDSIKAIAREKGGIIKSGVSVITCQYDQSALQALQVMAEEKKSKFTQVKTDKNYTTDLRAQYQQDNIALAEEVMAQLPAPFHRAKCYFSEAIKNVVKTTGFMGRFMQVQQHPPVILDAGHNSAGIAKTWASFAAQFPDHKKTIVVACSDDKDLTTFFDALPVDIGIILTTFNQPRSLSSDKLLAQIPERHLERTKCFSSVQEAVATTLTRASKNEAILISGSIYLVGEVLGYFDG